MNAGLQYGLYLALLAALAWPLGKYMFKVMNGDRVLLTPVLRPIEKGIYRLLRIDENEDMGWKRYAAVCVLFNLFGFLALWAMQLLQSVLPLNPEGMPGTSWHLGFNTAASFMTNTNWQAYSGETTLSYFTQMLGLCVQNFVSPAVGIAVMFALIRGLSRVRQHGVGSFYTDMVRGVVYVLMPLALVLSMVQTSQGVIQNFSGHVEYQLLEPVTASVETALGDGTAATQEVEVTKGYIPMGPASSQIAIKQLGTNGGGYNGLNSAHPLENPTPLSNLGEMLALLLIPAACCFAFGYGVKDKKQGTAIFLAMFILLVAAVGFCALSEHAGTPQLAQGGAVANPVNMEGKETRFGIPTSVSWATWTTAASNGSVNSMHDSYTPLGVARNAQVLGVIELKDIIKQGVKEKFADLRKMGIKTIMITGDNPLTAASIAAEAGVDDFLAEATPEGKLDMIRDFQKKGHLVAMTGDGTNDAPALAQADVAVAMNSGTQAAKEAGNMVDLDSSPTKLIDVVRIGKQLLMTRGSLTTFSIANDVAKYFAIIPAMFVTLFPGLQALNIMKLHSPQSAILSAIIYNALIIIALIPLALKGVKYREVPAKKLLSHNLLVYGLGGLAAPFIFIKLIDLLLVAARLV